MSRVITVRPVISGVILIALIVSLGLSRVVFAAGESFTNPTDKTVYESKTLSVTDLQVNGTGDDQLNMNLYASGGSLQFNNSTGLSFDGPSFGSSIQFSGTRSAINSALSTLFYISYVPGEYTIEATLGGGDGDVYNPSNRHVYQVVTASGEGINWADAKAAAEGMTYGGVSGYLATITSQPEHEFILDRISEDGWIGANDIAVEGAWRWATGPEAGTQFWSGNGDTGSAFGDEYSNWNQTGENQEPNNAGEGEDCAEVRFTDDVDGEWNDRDCGAFNMAYVVEFGDDENLPTISNTSFDVSVTEAPEIAFTNLIPADNSTVTPTNSLSITFNQPMELAEGSLFVYDASDNSEVAELWSGQTEDGLTFVFELPEALIEGESYYVNLTQYFFDGVVEYYDGFEDMTTWNFTVISSSFPNGGDANDDGVLDNEQDNVGGYNNTLTGKFVAIDVGEDCDLTVDDITQEKNFDVQDAAYEYDNGLWEFEADCGTPGFTTTIKLYYYDVSADDVVARKHNPVTGAYFTLTDAVISSETIDNQEVVVVTYQITDGGERDVDATENGEIVDPVGLASLVVGAPNTGIVSVRDLLFVN